MEVEIIEPHGLCAGVNAAVAKALSLHDVYCLHELVHNEIVVKELKELGYKFVERVEDVPEGASVVFSAHGVGPSVRARAAERRLKVIDTTCPFVARVHRAAEKFAEKNLPVAIIGNASHIEVKGYLDTLSSAGLPDDMIFTVSSVAEARRLTPAVLPAAGSPRPKLAVISQTTMNSEEVAAVAEELSRRFSLVRSAEVCSATRERQNAVRNFTGDALLVLGSSHSSNTRRLCEVSPVKTFLAGTMDEVRKLDFTGVKKLGITSGASTPERFFNEAVRYLRRVPEHVAVIMDGNGRWATARGLRRSEGHAAGAKTLGKMLEWCGERGIRYLTVYAFSTENWKRPRQEVNALMALFSKMLKTKAKEFVKNRVRFRMVGRRGDLPAKLLEVIESLEEKTRGFEREFIVAISYGGRAEIIDAVNRVEGPVTEETFRKYLYAPDIPDPDLVIRTSGERRISNFLLWESAYSEFHFSDVLWPDFSEADFDLALEDYAGRIRRQGGV